MTRVAALVAASTVAVALGIGVGVGVSTTAQAASSSKARLVVACRAVVVPPAKDATGHSTLVVSASMIRALAKSGNRRLENVAKSIRRARHHKDEAKYVRNELLKASSTCHKLGLRTGA